MYVRLCDFFITIFEFCVMDCRVLQNSDGGKTVPLKEGEENLIKIEVTSESGVAKIYVIRVRRLSAKDAVLSGIKVSLSKITPDFVPHVLEYFCE